MAGEGSSIPARGRLGSAGKGRGSAQGLTYDRFVAEVGVGAAPEAECGGGRRRLPLELLLRRAPGRGKEKRGTGGSTRVYGGYGERWPAAELAGRGCSTAARTGRVDDMRAKMDGCSFYSRTSGATSCLSDEGSPALLRGTASASAGALGRGTGDGPLAARRWYDAARAPR
jgi:hypothetical protein